MAKKQNNNNTPGISSRKTSAGRSKNSKCSGDKATVPNPHPAELVASLLELNKLQTVLIKHLFRQL
jgi:hypothetical protein